MAVVPVAEDLAVDPLSVVVVDFRPGKTMVAVAAVECRAVVVDKVIEPSNRTVSILWRIRRIALSLPAIGEFALQ